MFNFGRRILSLLLLGHLIAGVNREILNDTPDSSLSGVLSREATKILHFHQKESMNNDDFSPVFSRRKRSVTSSFCPPYDSCSHRCGEQPRDLPYTCNCDPICTKFSDCCIDYDQHCGHQVNETLRSKQLMGNFRLECEILFMKYNLLIVNKCPDHHTNLIDKRLCASKLPKDCHIQDNFNVSHAELGYLECKKSVHRNCMARFQLKCNVHVEPQCVYATTKKCSQVALNTCRSCKKTYWPVFGENGVLYRNSFCALCNSQKNYTVVSPYSLKTKLDKLNVSEENGAYFSRQCIPVNVNSCPKMKNDDGIQELCHNYSGAVIAGGRKGLIYKNMHCAICNGESSKNLQCATKASLMRGLIRPLLENFITGDVQGMKFDDIPAAFSILLNFGLDGQERMYFSSEGEEEMARNQERCGEGKIWDPFSQICRKLYCSTEFVLMDYRCVRKEPTEDFIPKNQTSVVPDARAEFVHLTLSAEIEMLDFLQFHGQDIETIIKTVRESLANSFSINIDRIKDVQFNISMGDFGGLNETLRFIEEMDEFHPIKFIIDFNLYEGYAMNVTASEPSVDSIVSMLASSLSMNGFEFEINNVTSRIFGIQQTVSPLTSWCNAGSGGEKKEYWNSEFHLVTSEDNLTESVIQGIYVNETGKFYSRGEFVGDILFQGYQFGGSLINVSGVAVVCDRKNKVHELNESCIRIVIESDEYSIFENGSLFIHNESLREVVDDSIYEVADNSSLWVCLKSFKTIGYKKIYRIEMDIVQALVSFVLLWISVIAMAIVLITYIAFESLRNLPGCNTMNLTFSLMVMQITFLFGQRGTVKGRACTIVGHLLHYETICSFMWMNIMAFDLFRTFGNRNNLSSIRSKSKYLPLYMIYAYLSPVIVVITTSLLDYYLNESPFAPHYGKNDVCWITSQNAAIAFFAAPLAVIMLINFVLFLLTILAMRSVKSLSHLKDQQTNRRGGNDVFLYVRMALVIGLTWALSFAAASVSQNQLVGKVLTYLFIIFNTLQGLFLFWVFVCNRRVYDLYKEGFRSLFHKIYKHKKHESSSFTISRLSNPMTRSVSSNTVVSTLSNASSSSNDSDLAMIPE